MRAALTYLFTYELKGGDTPFKFEERDKRWSGNPVHTKTVSTYMKSLKRRKARLGEKAESVCSIKERDLRKMFEYNAQIYAERRIERAPSTELGDRIWGGFRKRIMMSLIYAIAFQCFLRSDEVLRVEVRHFRLLDEKEGKLALRLDFRKQAQGGGKLACNELKLSG